VIYTVGDQKDLDAAPLRWEIIQKVLALLSEYVVKCKQEARPSHFLIEKSKHTGAFPHIRIHSDAGREDLDEFIKTTLENDEWSLPQHFKALATEFITSPVPSKEMQDKLIAWTEDEIRVRQTVLCLRGMIGSNVLLNGLMEKRWRVHFGLDLKRSLLAVPFRAKVCSPGF
jgi:hypothetical protein